jgi:hypothetical protein
LVSSPVLMLAAHQDWSSGATFIAVILLTCIVAGIGWHSPLYRRWH